MERFVCPDCGKASYSADVRSTHECPYCTEKVVVLNNRCLNILTNLSYVRLICDRRQGERRQKEITVNNDQRFTDRRQNNGMVVGWVTITKKDNYSEPLTI